jgi:ankyrin repeat protein
MRVAFPLALACLLTAILPALSQIPPGPSELRVYQGLHAAAAKDDAAEIKRLIAAGEMVDAQDSHSRTPLHVAAHFGRQAAAQALLQGRANPNALDAQRYDIVTIAAVNNDVPMLKLALAGGCDPKAITSPYNGTALIAAAHLGHAEVVRVLIAAGAPLDHVNNLGWTALMESIVLGNGGKNHTDTLEALVKAGANLNIADRQGVTPLGHAKSRGYGEMVRILESAGAR